MGLQIFVSWLPKPSIALVLTIAGATLAGCTGHKSASDVLPVVSADGPDPDFSSQRTNTRLHLTELWRAGWDSLADSTRPLTNSERRVGGAVLSRPVSVAEAPGGRIYVLDADYKKVVVFDSGGNYVRLVVGGYGRGPGEFIDPRSLTLGSDGSVYVLDRARQDVQRFDPHGKYLSAFRVRQTNPLQIVLFRGRLYIKVFGWTGRPHVFVYDTTGGVKDSLMSLAGRVGRMADNGEVGALAVTGGNLLYALPTPGLLVNLDQPDRVRGRDLEPGISAVMLRRDGSQIAMVPVGVRGIIALSGSELLFAYDRFSYQSDHRLPMRFVATDTSGQIVGDADASFARYGAVVGSSAHPNRFYMLTVDPSTRVIAMEIGR